MSPSNRLPGLEKAGCVTLLAFMAALQFSIAAAGMLLALTTLLWLALVIRNRERIEWPAMFWPLLAYAGATLVASLFSLDPAVSFRDSKQLVLFAIVPIAYRLLRGDRTLTAVDVIITAGAIHAVYGIVQYGILGHDNLVRRVQGLASHYMTYSGVIMLVACAAAARILFRRQDRAWAVMVMPALVVALALTLSRNAWVGACAGIGTLCLLRDFRLVALLPVAVGVFVAIAPAQVTERLSSMFSLQQLARTTETAGATVESNRDRIAMFRSGFRMIKDDPLTGVGPDMVIQVYPAYRDPSAVRQLNPHLHNVPLQIAAERGLPALGIWCWFIVVLFRDFLSLKRRTAVPSLATAGLAVVVAMLAAGLFEYNFGDSEFLMLFLVLVTLPYAAERSAVPAVVRPPRAA
ncbi:MAG TPA: O-antigen ligase family protein [Vicinamibacterales bacterium]|nr:O-antigen ligase family protein [Vicinamibacterales bacterium]